MGAPLGNKNGRRAQLIRAAIRRALHEETEALGRSALVEIHRQTVKKALEGDLASTVYIAERLDGKAAQTVEMTQNVNVSVSDEHALASRLAAQLTRRAVAGDTIQ
jgi:hypothetical protein